MTGIKQIRFEILALIFLSASIVFAQENRCNLKIGVIESESGISIIEADITVRNLITNEVFDNKGQIDEFIFLNLPEADYEITTRRENFKQSVDRFKLNCKSLDRNGYSFQNVVLRTGDSKEKIETDNRGKTLPKVGVLFGSQDIDEEVVKKRREERLKKFAKLNNILNSEATYLEKAKFPRAAQAVRASGIVYVRITVDEKGTVESAQAVSGHPLLRPATVEAAKKAKFNPTVIDGKPVKITGLLIYNFTL